MTLRPLLFVLLSGALTLGPMPASAQQPGTAPHAERPTAAPHGLSPSEPAAQPAPFARPRPALVVGEVTTARFRILHTERSAAAAAKLAERVEQTRDSFVRVLGRDWPGITEIRLGMGRQELEALALDGRRPPGWAVALAYPRDNVILLDALTLLKPEGEMTLRHELSHVALGQLSGGWPAWFQEGMAMYLTGDRFSLSRYAALFRAVTQDRLFRFEDLVTEWPSNPDDVEIAYAQSVSFVAWIVENHGTAKLGALVDEVRRGAPFEVAFARVLHTSIGVEEGSWRDVLPRRYSWFPIITGGSALWALASAILVVGYFRRRYLRTRRLAQMEAEDAAEEAARRLAHAASLPGGFDGELGAEEAGPPGPWDDDELSLPSSERGAESAADEETPRPRRLLH